MKRTALTCLLCLIPALAMSQDKRDNDIFGVAPPRTNSQRIEAEPIILEDKLRAANDKLQLGGLMYMRMRASITDGTRIDDHKMSMPNLVDLYLDSRPNDRLRGFVRGRLNWDPTIDESAPLNEAQDIKQLSVLLDQLWLKTDIGRELFITIGKQPIRWGTTRIWNPVDVVNGSRRVPLSLFDERTGVAMVKLHLPIESLGWNFYALTLVDEVETLDEIGLAGRAELVFWNVELGLTGAWRKDVDPKAGIDISAGVLDMDLTAEVGMTFEDELPTLQVSAGMEYGVRYSESDAIYIGAEWFYNQNGSTETDPIKLFSGETQFFYTGRHYGAVFISLPSPGLWNDSTFALSTVANLSDRSFLTRLDLIQRVKTFMTLQAYATIHYGRPGELNLGPDAFDDTTRQIAQRLLYPDDPSRELTKPVVDLGLMLRINL
ncbi:MAG TPA: hypothetical protein EYN66_06255 [Myxococcales bacterium]|nr:hypothetical protein [Myxococcales bacterium]